MPPKAQAKTVETVEAPALASDESAAESADENLVSHPKFGLISWADLEEVMRAEARSEIEAKKSPDRRGPVELVGGVGESYELGGEEKPLGPICETCFAGGWEAHPTAVASDSVTCEHGSWNRKA